MFKYFTKGDIVLIIVLVFLSVVSFAGVGTLYNSGKHVVVEVDGRHVLELPLDTDITETVKGPLGETIIVIENGTARIPDSPCPDHYCIRMGPISRVGEIVVCVPNHVFMKITSNDKDESYDGVTQ